MFRIKEILKEKKMTMQNLADLLGINRVTLSNSISGNPTISTLEKIAETLDVPLRDLFDGEDKDNAIICPNCGEKINITVTTK